MKILKSKYFIFLVFIIISIIAVTIKFRNNYYNRKTLEATSFYNKVSGEILKSTINKDNLKIELTNYQKSFDNNKEEMNFYIKISSNSKKLKSVIFNTLVYDKDFVIWNGISNKKYNMYRKFFFKDFYNKYDWFNTQDILFDSGPFEIKDFSPEDYSYLLYNIKIGLNKEYSEKDTLFINLIDVKYQLFDESSYKNISNTDFKFNIKFNNN